MDDYCLKFKRKNIDSYVPKKMASVDVIRHRPNFPENIWSDCFNEFSLDKEVYHSYAKEIEKLKEEVRMMILAAESNNIVEKITLIDIVERLGLSYHFEEEIEQQLELMFNLNTTFEDYDLCKTALLFRIFRQHGYKISCGSFDKFVDENGKFKETLSSDIKGMLSLFEAAQVRTQEDAILEEALAFTKANLKEKVQHCSSSSLMKQVTRALYQSLHRGVPRLEARHYITIYEEDESRNELLLSLAKKDYNLLQMLHKEELSELLRWWKELNISKLPYIRDRMVECYFWSLTVYFEPQFSFSRIIFTKITVAASVLDDTIDAYATVDEIPILSDAIQRWDEMEAQGLTGYIKACFLDLLKIYREVDESLRKEGSSLGVHHLKEAFKQYAKCSSIEAMWFMKGELPTFSEYLSNGSITSGYYLISVASFLGMKSATKEVFDWVETTPKIVLKSMAMSRLANDVASHRIEKQRANATGIDCYMKNYKVSEQEAMEKFEEMVEDSWKEINMEMLIRPMAIPREILVRVLSLTHSIDVIYKNREDGYTEPQKAIAPHIITVLLDPVVL